MLRGASCQAPYLVRFCVAVGLRVRVGVRLQRGTLLVGFGLHRLQLCVRGFGFGFDFEKTICVYLGWGSGSGSGSQITCTG